MLFVGSKVHIFDNSGATEVKLINLQVKKTIKSSYVKTGSSCLSIVKKTKTFFTKKRKILKTKSFILVLLVGLRKKASRKNGFFLHFNYNAGIPYEYKNKRYQTKASRVYIPILKEIKRKSKYKYIVLKAKKVL